MHDYPECSETQGAFHACLSYWQKLWFIIVSYTQRHPNGSRPGPQPSTVTTHDLFIT